MGAAAFQVSRERPHASFHPEKSSFPAGNRRSHVMDFGEGKGLFAIIPKKYWFYTPKKVSNVCYSNVLFSIIRRTFTRCTNYLSLQLDKERVFLTVLTMGVVALHD